VFGLFSRKTSVVKPIVQGFYERITSSVQYVVADPETKRCAIIDPVLDFEEKSGSIATRSVDTMLTHIGARGYTLEWILDTHPHADHLSAAAYLKEKTGVPIGIGARIVEVQKLWKEIYNFPDFPADGSQWDKLFADGETFKIGNCPVEVIHSPGHTLASITYVAGDAAFIHDTLFMPDGGTARADFPGGDAAELWRSIQRIIELPSKTRLFTGHDYTPSSRIPAWESTVAEQKAKNTHLRKVFNEADYVDMRNGRDKTLPLPNLMLLALQVNINGGRLPEPESNGRRYLKVPIDAFPGAAWG
jgi:glyoxylase-like metal-dependent hydrolase (beta-lactamase superfamily II)